MHDSSPWSVGEAMMLGTPVVCLDYAGPSAIIGDSGGVAVPLGGDVPAALARALAEVDGHRTLTDRWSTDTALRLLDCWYETAREHAGC